MSDLVVSLIAPPGKLATSDVEGLRSAWAGKALRWLAPDQAAEFSIPAVPPDRWERWSDLQEHSVDLVVQPAEGRRKRLLLADMDSTMIQQECIDELAEMAGVGARVKAITAQAMDGALNFEEAMRARVALLKGLPEQVIGSVLADRITYTPGGAVLLATMKAHGAYTALVSGGFTAFTEAVAAHLGFDMHRANVLGIAEDQLTGLVEEPVLGQQSKIDVLDTLTAKLGITDDQVIAVGDGANDLGMLGRAGLGVALHAKPTVAQACHVRINFGDLTALLFLQGYTSEAFVTS